MKRPRGNPRALFLARVGMVGFVGIGAFIGLVASAAPAVADADAHTRGLLEQGRYALERGDAVTAAKTLRIACFGLLEEPPLLVECLTRLGIAQARAEDAAGFNETFRRLDEVLFRFPHYATLPAELRERFEDDAARLVSANALGASTSFRQLNSRQREAEIRRLSPNKRREALQERVVAEPDNGRWKLLLAETALQREDWAEAIDWASKALPQATTSIERNDARCLRGFAHSKRRDCTQAIADFLGCDDVRTTPEPARAYLGCLVETERWREATDLLAALSPDLRGDRQVEALARKVRPPSEAPPPEPLPEPTPDPAEVPAAPQVPATNEPVAATPSPAQTQQLADARRLLGEARRRADLNEPLRLAREVADALPNHSESQHLVATIAYRSSNWAEAVRYFRRGGEPTTAEQLFYLAVALWETGDKTGAADVLRRSLPGLERTPFVESYREKIQSGAPPPTQP